MNQVMMKRILLALACAMMAWPAQAVKWLSDLEVSARVGLSLGGTMPLGMPASIRSLEEYEFKCNPMLGVDVEKRLDANWGVMAGLCLERKGMEIDARVKNYHITIVRGGETLTGMFTGRNCTIENQWELSIPVMAAYHLRKVRIMAGPYLAYVTDCDFHGYAYDGYLRVDDPTGPKVLLGSSETERGQYDFSEDMRRFQWGVEIGADWSLSRHFGVYGMVEWGLNGIYKGTFHTIEQTLYPIYGTVGVVYRW